MSEPLFFLLLPFFVRQLLPLCRESATPNRITIHICTPIPPYHVVRTQLTPRLAHALRTYAFFRSRAEQEPIKEQLARAQAVAVGRTV